MDYFDEPRVKCDKHTSLSVVIYDCATVLAVLTDA